MEILEILKNSSFLWLSITIGGFMLGTFLNKKFKTIIFNSLLISVVLVIVVMKLTNTSYEAYMEGGRYIGFLLTPATAALGVKFYKNINEIRKNAIPIIGGILIGIFISFTNILIISKIFGLDTAQYATILPKSITAAIAKGVSESLGGNIAITTTTVILTGVFIGVFGKYIIKIFKVKDPIAMGIALGASGHGQGTALALKESETAGAVASLSMCISALVTVVLAPLWFNLTIPLL